jgi:hypothetical protein
MSTSTTRTTFRETVALVAAKAKEKLPAAVNGRIERAVKLVLAGDVEAPATDGSITVHSSTDATRRYVLQGHACTCADFERGQAPEGWCAHRIAAGIAKRVGELLPPAVESTPHVHLVSTASLPEAPASVNVRLTIGGREVQLTLRDSDEVQLLARLEEVLQRFPQPQAPTQAPRAPQAPTPEEKRYCPRHGTEMQLNHKDGRSWWSHRLPEGGFCKGR